MFTHLHVHSQFSLLESSIRIKDLVRAAGGLGMESLALTDKYVMNGLVEFYREATSAGIKPILGCEICILFEQKPGYSKTSHLYKQNITPQQYNYLSHLIMLVKNKKGYENLCQLVSKSHLDNTYGSQADKRQEKYKARYKSLNHEIPAVRMKDIRKFSSGLICLESCSRSALLWLLSNKNTTEAKRLAGLFLEIFGKDFYISIQRYRLNSHNLGKNPGSEVLLNFASRLSIPVVAVNNVHYLKRSDFNTYKYLTKIKLMSTKRDPTTDIIDNDEHYLKSDKEMKSLFYDVPRAIKNTDIIAEKCNFDLELGRTIIPEFNTPAGESQESYLKRLCHSGLEFRFGKNPGKKITDRLAKEIKVINSTGFTGYFLVVADIARFAYNNGIPICGKGSAAGSLVSYILRISNVDPVKNNLYFERFLSLQRIKPPDIDIDIANRDRAKVIRYLQSKYGYDNIARVSSFVTTKPRASIREAGRIFNIAKEEIDCIIKSAPGYNRFFTTKKMQQRTRSSKIVNTDSQEYKKIISISAQISDYIRHISMHPSALIVSNDKLSKKIPLAISETKEIMSQYDMNSIDDIGILKIDLINSLSLTLIADTSKKIKRGTVNSNYISNINHNDSKTYRLMQEGNTLGVFQLESFGIRTLSRKIKPSCINDITLLISLYRPGPQQSGMVNNFIERKFNREKTSFIHKDLEPILRETHGIILYQEQAMQVAMKIAGYSLNEADTLRKAITGLSGKEMLAQRSRFINGAATRGYDTHTADKIFNLISKFASYGFVKAHAAAYAELSYKTCFLKVHYPAEFLSTILTNNSGYYSKMQYIEEARRSGIIPRLPDINKSGYDFVVEDNSSSIRVPLVQVRNLGSAAVDSITGERKKNGAFKDFFDFYKRASKNPRITKTSIENLIKVGAFDYTKTKRRKLLVAFYYLNSLKKPDVDFEKNRIMQDEKLKDDFSIEERLKLEARLLGFYVSAHPLFYFKERVIKSRMPHLKIIRSGLFRSCIFSGSFKNQSYYRQASCILSAGIVISKRIEKTKDKKNMMFCTIEDEDGMYEAVFFPGVYHKSIRIIMNSSFIIIKGRLHLRDNNISIIAKDIISIKTLKKMIQIKNEENIKAGFISELPDNLWAG